MMQFTPFVATSLFSDVFNDYNDFKEFSESLDINVNPVFDVFCFNVLFRHYSHRNIRYSDEQAFLNELGNVYTQEYVFFEKQDYIIKKLYNFDGDDITTINRAISNYAENPNNNPDNVEELLPYITNQTGSIIKSSLVGSYLDYLNNLPVLNSKEFIRKFEYLFTNLNYDVVYGKGE